MDIFDNYQAPQLSPSTSSPIVPIPSIISSPVQQSSPLISPPPSHVKSFISSPIYDHTLFRRYVPHSFYYFSFSELAFSCLSFYHECLTREFLCDACRLLDVATRAKGSVSRPCHSTGSWRSLLLKPFTAPSKLYYLEDDKIGLTQLGRLAFTPLGVNIFTTQGRYWFRNFQKASKTELQKRLLPPRLKILTVYDYIGLVCPYPRFPGSLCTFNFAPREWVRLMRRYKRGFRTSRGFYRDTVDYSVKKTSLDHDFVLHSVFETTSFSVQVEPKKLLSQNLFFDSDNFEDLLFNCDSVCKLKSAVF
ncbi:hypothetical protein RCL1_000166 [Eukaryota sp. TZLM3-RCL]